VVIFPFDLLLVYIGHTFKSIKEYHYRDLFNNKHKISFIVEIIMFSLTLIIYILAIIYVRREYKRI